MPKRRRYDNKSGMAAGVDYLLRKQGRLKGNTPVSSGAVDASTSTGKASVPTFLVASSTARSSMRRIADFVCSGTDDNLVLQEAFDALPTSGGRIMLTEGEFNLESPAGLGAWGAMVDMPANSSLVGTGAGTVLNVDSTAAGTTHVGVKLAANCEVAHMSFDISTSSDLLYAINGLSADGKIHHCWFDGMSVPTTSNLWYVLAKIDTVVSECTFEDVTNGTGVELYDATVVGSTFKGTGTAIESFGDDTVISNNRFIDKLQVTLTASSYTTVTGNIFDGASITKPYLYVDGGYGTVISGNYFDGNTDESQEVISIGGGYTALSIVGNVISSGVLLDRGDAAEDTLSIVGNTWVAGGGILMDVGATNWRYSSFLIANNNMDAWQYGGSAFIHLIGSAGFMQDISILNNVLSATSVDAGAGPLIDVEFPDTTANNGRAIRIVGNKIVDRRAAVDANLGIRVTGPTTKTDGNVDVWDNHVEASDGIEITYVRDVVCSGNRISVDENATSQTYYAGQLKVALCGTAIVDDNVVVSGEDGDKAGTGAAISVEAVDGGSIRNNSVWGIVSGALDTALSVNGPFYVIGNAYYGEHSLNTGTAFTTELETIGTGAIVGNNEMDVDDTGGTGTTFIDAKFPDDEFAIFDEADDTRILNFDLGSITTATTRTWTVPDLDGTVTIDGLLLSGGTMSGDINYAGNDLIGVNQIEGIAAGSVNLYGGVGATGARIEMFSGTHASLANDMYYNADEHVWRDADGTPTLATFSDTAGLNLQAHILLGVIDPTLGNHVGDRDYNDARYLELDGTGTMTGNFLINGNNIVGIDRIEGVAAGSVNIYGGAGATGARIELFSGTHASLSDDMYYDADQHVFRDVAGVNNYMTMQPTGVGIDFNLDISQDSTTGAVPVLTLDQQDVDEDYFKFIGTSDTSVDRALVDAVDFTTPGSIAGWLKINIQDDQSTNPITDGDYYLPFYGAPTA